MIMVGFFGGICRIFGVIVGHLVRVGGFDMEMVTASLREAAGTGNATGGRTTTMLWSANRRRRGARGVGEERELERLPEEED